MRRRVRAVRLLAASLVCAGLANGAAAAELEATSPGGGRTTITVSGELEPGDDFRFIALTRGIRNAVVVFESTGGALLSGLNIGTVISRMNFETRLAPGAACEGSCALAYLAGSPRLAAGDAVLDLGVTLDESDPEMAMAQRLLDAFVERLAPPASGLTFGLGPGSGAVLDAPELARLGLARIEPAAATSPPATPSATATPPATPGAGRAGGWTQGPVALERPEGEFWIVIEAARRPESLDPGRYGPTVRAYNLIRVRASNGVHAAAIGPFPAEEADRLRSRLIGEGEIPRDSYLSQGKGFVELVP